uniref:Mandelate racemase/muconate lactonizing enzyme C-terminal domain-containing protein n=1 Tax=Oryza barthii TaxID=65489 RepID=A0A0D3F6X6_9ORYZ
MLAVVSSSGHRLLPLPVLPGTFTTPPPPPPPPPLLSPRRPLLAPRRRRCLCGGGGGGLLLLRAVAARRAGIVIDVDEVGEVGDRDLPVDVSFTRRLPPVLTLGDGLAALRRAGEEVKACPPAAAASGIIRFEVLVPPSTKALKWLCTQFKRSSLFPQFYLSRKQTTDSSIQLEISGAGSAICFHGSSRVDNGFDLISRYLSFNSHLIRAYGSVGVKYDKELLSLEERIGSFYFFIPQVELSEFDGYSMLSSTIVWDDSVSHTFEDSVCLFESCFSQIWSSYDSSATICYENMVTSYIGESRMSESRNTQLVYLDAEFLAVIDGKAVTEKDLCLQSNKIESFIRRCSNINLAWASFIVEEFVRLGFTYFCIAPGSRSSPLALSASVHPLTTCISCYDERSLGFHALGYGRGSRKPAIVITSSGTAVSNLLPSVVEASQDFVPLILLTADRPPELQDVGANQAINQVNHFGSFVRHFFSLPPPDDHIYARMVLTTVDSAAYYAMQAPQGPVHINCAFREPLDYGYQDWSVDCLKGLDKWFINREPYTRYLGMKMVSALVMEVLEIVKNANQGLLLVGAIHTEDDIWAVTLLARHLSWPIAADVLSGLRMRKVQKSIPGLDKSICFIDHIDQILLSESVKSWKTPDVIVQIGSRITSKRVGTYLESCSPSSYILIDAHPCRHDPSHVVTHRIQATITEFAASLCQCNFQTKTSRWSDILMVLNSAVSQEIMFQVHSECSLTEPYVAHVIGEALYGDATMFIGNSMVIRDLDMFGKGWIDHSTNANNAMMHHFPGFLGAPVAGNRGASGIDGLLSTSIGFAIGSNKHVFCVIGDISFLHDTNGLSLLNQRIKHILVQTKAELHDALVKSHEGHVDCVVEVENRIVDNANFHRFYIQTSSFDYFGLHRVYMLILILQNYKHVHRPYCNHASGISSGRSILIQLAAPRTSGISESSFFHEGFILKLCVGDSIVGFGEVAPIEIHEEDLLDVEEQLRFLFHRMKDAELDVVPLLRGSFSNWIWTTLGIPPSSVFPSVKCGLEMAILNLLESQRIDRSYGIFTGSNVVEYNQSSTASIQICALVDSCGTPMDVTLAVVKLVAEGFTTIKLKVGRRENPAEDAAVIQKVREIVGYKINIRADANRKWTYEQAIDFGSREPVDSVNDIIKFCENSGLPVALDETIDNLTGDVIPKLHQFSHPGIVALVIKPSVVGGFEAAACIAKWAHMHDKMAVISSTYESSVGLATYIQFAHYVDRQNDITSRIKNKGSCGNVAHGLGTYQWLREDVSDQKLKIHVPPLGDGIRASAEDAHGYLQHLVINDKKIERTYSEEKLRSYFIQVDGDNFSYQVKLQEGGDCTHEKVILFLHGFLGTSEDWVPMMKALSPSARVIAVDLPGHGESEILQHDVENSNQISFSVQSVADLLLKLIRNITDGAVVVVGYSMGARIALHMALNQNHKISGAVIISGSPGLRDEASKRRRSAIDRSRAHFLSSCGLENFLETWYSAKMWASLREHPKFDSLVRTRMKHNNIKALSKVLADSSIGTQKSLWEDLKHLKSPLLIVAGEKDPKFKEISQQMCREIRKHKDRESDGLCEMIIIPDSGHAVHVENPLPLVRAIRKFLVRDVPDVISK